MILASFLSVFFLYPHNIYLRSAMNAEEGNYDEALEDLQKIQGYENSNELMIEYTYLSAVTKMDAGQYEEARDIFLGLGDYRDSGDKIKECNYLTGHKLLDEGKYEEAAGYFLALNEFKDSKLKYLEAVYYLSIEEYRAGEYELFYDHFGIICDAGYFNYDILESENRDEAAKLVKPTCVNIYGDLDDTQSSWDYYTGEAAVYKITPEYVYFLSAAHVLEILDGFNCNITFFDGSGCNTGMDAVFSDDGESDLSMFKVSTKDIPIEVLVNLKEINASPWAADELGEGDRAFILSNYWYGRSDMVSDTRFAGFGIDSMTEGIYSDDHFLAFERCSVDGQSGSPLFDEKGRCLAIASSYYFYERDGVITFTIDCHSRLDEALSLYEKAGGSE